MFTILAVNYIWVFPKIGVPQNGWFIMENPITWMIWGHHYFRKHSYVSTKDVMEKTQRSEKKIVDPI